MSYNIRHGLGLDDVLDLSRSASIIRQQDPHLCGMQEVDNNCLRSGRISQADYLADNTQMISSFGKFMDYDGGAYGMATLSKLPLLSTRVLSLPDGKYEPRTAIVHKVTLSDNCSILFANVHLEWIDGIEGDSIRMAQAKTLVEYLNSQKGPVIVTGDFNCTPSSQTMQYFNEEGFVFVNKGIDRMSYQGEKQVEIDHLVYRNTNSVSFKTKSVKLLKEPIASDHRPLIVELEVQF